MRISGWSSDVCSSDLSLEVCHEGPVLPEIGEGPSPRLQGRASPWQGLRDLQEQPALQGAPALRHLPALPGSACVLQVKGRRNAAFCRLTPGVPASASVSRPDVPPRPRAGFGIRAAWPESAPPGVPPCPVSAAVRTRPGRTPCKPTALHLPSLFIR